jgi:hypothetical protein
VRACLVQEGLLLWVSRVGVGGRIKRNEKKKKTKKRGNQCAAGCGVVQCRPPARQATDFAKRGRFDIIVVGGKRSLGCMDGGTYLLR